MSARAADNMFKTHFDFATFPALGKDFFRLLMGWRCIFKSIHDNIFPSQFFN